jgi:hypothetical protein
MEGSWSHKPESNGNGSSILPPATKFLLTASKTGGMMVLVPEFIHEGTAYRKPWRYCMKVAAGSSETKVPAGTKNFREKEMSAIEVGIPIHPYDLAELLEKYSIVNLLAMGEEQSKSKDKDLFVIDGVVYRKTLTAARTPGPHSIY